MAVVLTEHSHKVS